MTATATPPNAGGAVARVRAILALDGPLAALLLTVFQYFLVSVSFIGCLVPAFAFEALVGWQATHLALWLGALSLLPLVPAGYALLRSSRRLLAERGDARAGRQFWRSFAQGCRMLWWAALAQTVVVLLLAYDFALFGSSDAVMLLVMGAAALAAAVLVGVCIVAAARGVQRPIETIAVAVRVMARRPHIALSWLLLIALGLAATTLPLAGAALPLFLPALLGVGIHVCNDALRLPLNDETRRTP